MAKSKQKTIEEKWLLDGIPNVQEPTEQSLAWVAWLREEEKKKKAREKTDEKVD